MFDSAYWTLVGQLLKRDLQERYMGTWLGVVWLIMQPLLMVAIYTLVFSHILQVRFNAQGNSLNFTFYVITGLAMFNALSEVLTRAPSIFIDKRDWLLNLPLSAAILPLIPVLSSIVTELVMVTILLLLSLALGQFHGLSLVFYPLFLLLRVSLSLSAAYSLAVLGIFARDLRQLIPPMLTVLLLLSPIVYPLEAVPANLKSWYALNPLIYLIQGYRAALLQGDLVWTSYFNLAIGISLSGLIAYWLFQQLMPRARYVL